MSLKLWPSTTGFVASNASTKKVGSKNKNTQRGHMRQQARIDAWSDRSAGCLAGTWLNIAAGCSTDTCLTPAAGCFTDTGPQNHMESEKSNQLPFAEHIKQEVRWDASLESHPEYLPSQALTSELPLGQELDVVKQTLEPLDSTLPRSVLVPEATVLNLEDMPPLPPLPPMQCRMGIQYASPFFRERIGWSWSGFFAANTAIGIC